MNQAYECPLCKHFFVYRRQPVVLCHRPSEIHRKYGPIEAIPVSDRYFAEHMDAS